MILASRDGESAWGGGGFGCLVLTDILDTMEETLKESVSVAD